jgi:prophage antirepressor-like protein
MQLSLSENIKIFNNAEFGEIRVMLIDDDPWFVGKDIAVALGYNNPQKAIRDHVDEQDRGVNEMDPPVVSSLLSSSTNPACTV